MKLLDFFQRGYVINLPERVDRRKGTEQELQKLGMRLTPGKLELFAAIRPTESAGFPSIGAHGCFLSHLTVLKQAQRDGLSNVLIMEDDIFIDRRFQTVEADLMAQLSQRPWDFAYLGYSSDQPVVFPIEFKQVQAPVLTTSCYGVNGSSLDRLINFLETLRSRPAGHPNGGPMHLDGAYTVFREQTPDLIMLKTSSGLIAQRSSRSDIYPLAWYEKIPFASPMIEWARRGKTLLRSRSDLQ